MAAPANEQGNNSKGFAGLASMASDVDAVVSRAAASTQVQPAAPSNASSAPAQMGSQQPRSPANSGPSSGPLWLIGGCIVVVVLFLSSMKNNDPTASTSKYSPPTATTSHTSAAAPAPVPSLTPVVVPTTPIEELPPYGTGQVLNMNQLRYCTAEDIRLGAAQAVIDPRRHTDVDRFNSMVNDYNNRCGEFKYRRGTLEAVKAEVAGRRGLLEAEGRARFATSKKERAPQATSNKPSLAHLTDREQEAIESLCADKQSKGPAAYHACLTFQVRQLQR